MKNLAYGLLVGFATATLISVAAQEIRLIDAPAEAAKTVQQLDAMDTPAARSEPVRGERVRVAPSVEVTLEKETTTPSGTVMRSAIQDPTKRNMDGNLGARFTLKEGETITIQIPSYNINQTWTVGEGKAAIARLKFVFDER